MYSYYYYYYYYYFEVWFSLFVLKKAWNDIVFDKKPSFSLTQLELGPEFLCYRVDLHARPSLITRPKGTSSSLY